MATDGRYQVFGRDGTEDDEFHRILTPTHLHPQQEVDRRRRGSSDATQANTPSVPKMWLHASYWGGGREGAASHNVKIGFEGFLENFQLSATRVPPF